MKRVRTDRDAEVFRVQVHQLHLIIRHLLSICVVDTFNNDGGNMII